MKMMHGCVRLYVYTQMYIHKHRYAHHAHKPVALVCHKVTVAQISQVLASVAVC